jgi:hypothetical protein
VWSLVSYDAVRMFAHVHVSISVMLSMRPASASEWCGEQRVAAAGLLGRAGLMDNPCTKCLESCCFRGTRMKTRAATHGWLVS